MSTDALRIAATLATLGGIAMAQCTTQWLPGLGIAGVGHSVSHSVLAVHSWDRDGAGPLPPVTVFGGLFGGAGTTLANCIAVHDPATDTWSELGAGIDGEVRAIASLPNGDLVVGGSFTSAGNVLADNIARWDGTSWSAMGTGTNRPVDALRTMPNGD
ncbi:MAG: hypothetical protein IT456_27795, partial [Planctomycetes bacterium]|nr:hypothetical protein [Planctomycetota bacterium]